MTTRDLFLAALDIPSPDERTLWLDEQCGEDSATKEQVLSLLQTVEMTGDFMEQPLLLPNESDDPASKTTLERCADRTDSEHSVETPFDTRTRFAPYLEPGESDTSLGRLPGYEVLEVLGEGGMGVVFRVEDIKLKRVVALKVLAPEFAMNATARKRFLREAQAAASINHPHVVTIHGVDEHKLPYLVMECVNGISLDCKLQREGTLEEVQILRFGVQIAQGLAAAHEQSLIHRDVKPGNILLENGIERVKLTDFGLARAIDDVSITQTGQIAGTPRFMSPEQTTGQAIDHRSDLFSFGSVLYAMCTGRSPFRGANTIAVIQRIHHDTPRPIPELRPELSPELVAIIDRLLQKNPDDRFQSATEVGQALNALLQQKLKPQKPSVPEAAPQTSQGGRMRWIGAGLLLLCLILGASEASGRTQFAGTIIRMVRGEGTLVVEVSDPAVSVTLNGKAVVLTGVGPKEIRVVPGEYKVQATKDGQAVYSEVFTLTRGGKEQVRIGWEPTVKNGEKRATPIVVSPSEVEATPKPRPTPSLEPIPTVPLADVSVLAEIPFAPDEAQAFQAEVAEQLDLEVSHVNSLGMEFRLIPPGKFLIGVRWGGSLQKDFYIDRITQSGIGSRRAMNDQHEDSRHRFPVTLTQPYYMGSCEVTQKQYAAVMNTNPSRYQAGNESLATPPVEPTDKCPVEQVTWLDAVTFCNRLSELESLTPCYQITDESVTLLPNGTGYRLPTSAEWEFAARAGSNGALYQADATKLTELVWFKASFPENSIPSPQPVGRLLPNAFGLFDTLGNVAEFVWDEYARYEPETPPQTNPGGAVQSTSEDVLRTARGEDYDLSGSAFRLGSRQRIDESRSNAKTQTWVGFRVVCVIPAESPLP